MIRNIVVNVYFVLSCRILIYFCKTFIFKETLKILEFINQILIGYPVSVQVNIICAPYCFFKVVCAAKSICVMLLRRVLRLFTAR